MLNTVLYYLLLKFIGCREFHLADSSFIGLEKHNRFINLKEIYGAAFITTHGRNIAAATTTVEDPDLIGIYLSKSTRKSPEVRPVLDSVNLYLLTSCQAQ
jgi:hypothetical protein